MGKNQNTKKKKTLLRLHREQEGIQHSQQAWGVERTDDERTHCLDIGPACKQSMSCPVTSKRDEQPQVWKGAVGDCRGGGLGTFTMALSFYGHSGSLEQGHPTNATICHALPNPAQPSPAQPNPTQTTCLRTCQNCLCIQQVLTFCLK